MVVVRGRAPLCPYGTSPTADRRGEMPTGAHPPSPRRKAGGDAEGRGGLRQQLMHQPRPHRIHLLRPVQSHHRHAIPDVQVEVEVGHRSRPSRVVGHGSGAGACPPLSLRDISHRRQAGGDADRRTSPLPPPQGGGRCRRQRGAPPTRRGACPPLSLRDISPLEGGEANAAGAGENADRRTSPLPPRERGEMPKAEGGSAHATRGVPPYVPTGHLPPGGGRG